MTVEAEERTSLILSMLRRMQRPLVRFLVAQQIPYPLLARLLKSLYVEVATEDFPLPDKRQTVSRLSLLTGINRREIKRIQQESHPGEPPTPPAIALGAQIVARWIGEAPWIDEAGRPRALVRQSDEPEVLSFQRLVNSVSVDIHPRSVLDEWLRLGVASLDDEGLVVLDQAAFVPKRGFEEKAHYVGRNVRDHLAAAAANLSEEVSPFLERSVHYASLPEEAVEELVVLAREEGQRALERVDARARVLKERSREQHGPSKGPRRRFAFGVYEYDAASEAAAGRAEPSELDAAEEGGGDED